MKLNGRDYDVKEGEASVGVIGAHLYNTNPGAGFMNTQIFRFQRIPEELGWVRMSLFNALRFYWRPAILVTSGSFDWTASADSFRGPDGNSENFASFAGSDYEGVEGPYHDRYRGYEGENIDWIQLVRGFGSIAKRSLTRRSNDDPENLHPWQFILQVQIGSTIAFSSELAGGETDVRLVPDERRAFAINIRCDLGGETNTDVPRMTNVIPFVGEHQYTEGGIATLDFRDQDNPSDPQGMKVELPLYIDEDLNEEPGYRSGNGKLRVEYVNFPLKGKP